MSMCMCIHIACTIIYQYIGCITCTCQYVTCVNVFNQVYMCLYMQVHSDLYLQWETLSRGSVVHGTTKKVFIGKLAFEQINRKDNGVEHENSWKKITRKRKHQNFKMTEVEGALGRGISDAWTWVVKSKALASFWLLLQGQRSHWRFFQLQLVFSRIILVLLFRIDLEGGSRCGNVSYTNCGNWGQSRRIEMVRSGQLGSQLVIVWR